MDAWVDNPTPALGSDVNVFFNLLNEGIPINGLWLDGLYAMVSLAESARCSPADCAGCSSDSDS
jgi:hypothetical protein